MTAYRIMLGRTTRTGNEVSDDALNAFLTENVAQRFPGFTVYDATGFWNGARERTAVLDVLADNGADFGRVEAIARDYAEAFDQEAVLVSHAPADVSFVNGRNERAA